MGGIVLRTVVGEKGICLCGLSGIVEGNYSGKDMGGRRSLLEESWLFKEDLIAPV
jgi:hypothetical protein